MLPTLIAMFALAVGQTTKADQRLEFMKTSLKAYEFEREAKGPLTLVTDPVFRLGRQGDGMILDGAIFLWKDDVGRPEAAAQVFLHRYLGRKEGDWTHELTTLATAPLVASEGQTPRWSPAKPGVTFRPIPDAPRPAAIPAQRLRQMRSLAEQFKAEDDIGDKGRFVFLRMLTTPIARYGKADGTPEDGALFAFVEGTDPEVFLFIEARKGDKGLVWQYACAPMTCLRLKVSHAGQLVWEQPRLAVDDSTKTFFARTLPYTGSEPR